MLRLILIGTLYIACCMGPKNLMADSPSLDAKTKAELERLAKRMGARLLILVDAPRLAEKQSPSDKRAPASVFEGGCRLYSDKNANLLECIE